MKYARMVCWFTEEDKKRLEEFNLKDFPINFVTSSEELVLSIAPDTFVICSLQFAENDIETMINIVRKFPNILFHMFAIYENELTENGYSIGFEPNVIKRSFLTEEVLEELKKMKLEWDCPDI